MHTSKDRSLTRHSVNQNLLSSWSHVSSSNQHTRLYRKLCSNGFLRALHTLETVPARPYEIPLRQGVCQPGEFSARNSL